MGEKKRKEMAAHNYSITFVSLRGGFTYTVHIGGGTGTEIPLKGGSSPFVTQEDDSEDMFANIRTQSGYFRIVDDGKDDNGNAFNWKDLIPATDTSRPVTLTRRVNNTNVVMWQGFMQAQDFGSALYGNPQEREFPIQCVLSVLQGSDINYQHTDIENFAYLLKQIVDDIPGLYRPQHFVIQGGADARTWLLMKIDWQNFVSVDGDGNLMARYTLWQCLEDMCSFWGWTARTHKDTLYLMCADDGSEQSFLTLDYSQLAQLAGGTSSGGTSGTFSPVTLSGNIFANTAQEEYVQRGVNKAIVSVDTDEADEHVIMFADSKTEKEMRDGGWQSSFVDDDKVCRYTVDDLYFESSFQKGSAASGKASFNILQIADDTISSPHDDYDVIRIKAAYDGNIFAYLETRYEHFYYDGTFSFIGNIYRWAHIFKNYGGDLGVGVHHMYIRFGIGHDRSSAQWFNGMQWGSTQSAFKLTIGNVDENFWIYQTVGGASGVSNKIATPSGGLAGKIFIDFLGTDENIYDSPLNPDYNFQIQGFTVNFERNYSHGFGFTENMKSQMSSRREYVSKNANNIRNEFSADCIYGSDNLMPFSFGIPIVDNNGTLSYLTTLTYGNTTERPEQHLANRVTSFWARSRRRLRTELLSNVAMVGSTLIRDITPQYLVTMDGVQCHPLAISHDWRDDIVQLTLLDIEN